MSPRVRVFKREVPTWGLFICPSIVAGAAAIFLLGALAGLPRVPMLGIASFGVLAVVALAFATKIVTGNEFYNFHHHQIAVIAVTGVAAWLMGQPVLRVLDVVVLGVGVTYICGRLACFLGGCCYGRPFSWGVCYSSQYTAEGFPSALVGVKLFPSQLAESLWMLLTTVVGIIYLQRGVPGSTLTWVLILYAVGRFVSEFFRLDTGYCPRWLTEAQIAAVATASVVAGLELIGVLAFEPIHVAAALALVLILTKEGLTKSDRKLLFGSRHLLEIVDAVERVRRNRTMRVERTSLGLLISTGTIVTSAGSLVHYSVSREGAELTEPAARALAKLIARLCRFDGEPDLIKRPGVFHVIISKPTGAHVNGHNGPRSNLI